MSPEQADHIEKMLETIVQTVGTIMEEQTSMKRDISSMKEDITSIKEESDTRHKQVLDQLRALKADNDLIWEKQYQHERDIGIFKKLYG
ncbi:hypothetical protein JNUCC1_02884 [Lentibacillus sp. JNUCC-1]|uniref:hypothetical protein n=1 Tax=Lentibacillus sp. JNUCC-1 TaxID=2654513 RepID=UPI0012E8310B|nr:hypothetical protein [Lentibacillus sp. JNUCC-1]MUV39012.1 hypothetical protein [Lentibacillus sp. JNUCC-1]